METGVYKVINSCSSLFLSEGSFKLFLAFNNNTAETSYICEFCQSLQQERHYFLSCMRQPLSMLSEYCKSTVSRVQFLMFKLDWQPKELNKTESITIWL